MERVGLRFKKHRASFIVLFVHLVIDLVNAPKPVRRGLEANDRLVINGQGALLEVTD